LSPTVSLKILILSRMNGESLSPGRLAWQRLKKNRSAMFGLLVVAAAMVIAVFCYTLIPDNSPFSNRMSLPASMQHPGSKITFLKVPLKNVEEVGFFNGLISGIPSKYKEVAVKEWKLQNDSVFYKEFAGDEQEEAADFIALPLSDFGDKTAISSADFFKKKFLVDRVFILGTDRFGRDLFSRLMVGTRVSLSVGLIAVFISLVIGITLGAVAGYYRGFIDRVIVWFINVIWSIPTLLLVVAITMALGKGFTQVFIAVGLTMWVEVARLVRGQFFALREQQFVEAGRALGYEHGRIIIKHILPNIIGPVIVIAASNFASAILLEAGLSFLGMGAQPPMPSWGMMIKENYGYIVVDSAYLAIWPGVAIALMVLAFTLLGNGLRDAFDIKN
jgi:peptide/nickel transport system permease protein